VTGTLARHGDSRRTIAMADHQERARKYHQAIRTALLREWDPIGVAETPGAQDEYDSYVASVYKLLIQRSPVSRIFEYLWWLETEHMALVGDRQRTERFAERLARLSDEVDGSAGSSGG
jgi:hypothetical protein